MFFGKHVHEIQKYYGVSIQLPINGLHIGLPNELIVLFVFDIQEEFVEYRNSSLVERVNNKGEYGSF